MPLGGYRGGDGTRK